MINKVAGMNASEWRYISECLWRAMSHFAGSRRSFADACGQAVQIAAELEDRDLADAASWHKAVNGVMEVCSQPTPPDKQNT